MNPHLEVSMRIVKNVIQVDPLGETVATDEEVDPDDMEATERATYLATLTGRGVTKRFKDFSAAAAWFSDRKGYKPKLQLNRESELVVENSDDEDGD